MWMSWVNAVLGVWLIAVPFLGFTPVGLTWALVLTGIAVAVLAVWSAGQEASERTHIEQLEARLRHQ
jgi:uncharacterized iron-regulated membrane protein